MNAEFAATGGQLQTLLFLQDANNEINSVCHLIFFGWNTEFEEGAFGRRLAPTS
jgi:hypothetical protein